MVTLNFMAVGIGALVIFTGAAFLIQLKKTRNIFWLISLISLIIVSIFLYIAGGNYKRQLETEEELFIKIRIGNAKEICNKESIARDWRSPVSDH